MSKYVTQFTEEELGELLEQPVSATDSVAEVVAFTDAPSDLETMELQKLGKMLADLELAISDGETHLKRLKTAHFWLVHEGMPQKMAMLGVTSIGVGNSVVERRPYYKANISADWPEKKREAAFAELERVGGEDIIKSVVSANLGGGDFEKAKEIAEAVALIMEQMHVGGTVSHDKSVPWNTLTSFVKDCTKRQVGIDLDKLGAYVGEIAVVKALKEKK